jgi:hypothetical protein
LQQASKRSRERKQGFEDGVKEAIKIIEGVILEGDLGRTALNEALAEMRALIVKTAR